MVNFSLITLIYHILLRVIINCHQLCLLTTKTDYAEFPLIILYKGLTKYLIITNA